MLFKENVFSRLLQFLYSGRREGMKNINFCSLLNKKYVFGLEKKAGHPNKNRELCLTRCIRWLDKFCKENVIWRVFEVTFSPLSTLKWIVVSNKERENVALRFQFCGNFKIDQNYLDHCSAIVCLLELLNLKIHLSFFFYFFPYVYFPMKILLPGRSCTSVYQWIFL